MSNFAKAFLILCLVVGLYRVLHHPARFVRGADQVAVVRLLDDGQPVKDVLDTRRTRYLALYHGASWCPPCQAFSPTLAEFYGHADHGKFQLVMVNYDSSEADMIGYMRQHRMQFPAVLRGNAGGWSTSTGNGIPNLIIVDTTTGRIVDSSFDGDDYKGPRAPLEKLRQLIR